jgi:energy-coupling factor transporter ATP-binding protein EcfA2
VRWLSLCLGGFGGLERLAWGVVAMLRLEGILFGTDQGPVASGFVRFGDLTVLTGRNDSGKTRLLGLIEGALNRPEDCYFVELFGVMSEEELSDLIDAEGEDRGEIEEYVEPLDRFPVPLELPDAADGVRVAVQLESGTFSAWRYGRSPATLERELADRLFEVIPDGLHSGDPLEPVKLAYLGETGPPVLPEPIVVPTTPDELAREISFAVLRLSRALQELALRWSLELGGRGEPPGGLEENLIQGRPDRPVVGWVPSWRWLLDEEQHATVLHPAAIAAYAAVERIAQSLVPEFIREDYRLELFAAQPSDIIAGDPVRLGLMRLYPVPEGEDPADWDEEDLAFRFNLGDAPGGFALWLQLVLFEAIARASRISHILEDCARRLTGRGSDVDEAEAEGTRLLPYRRIDTPVDDEPVADREALEGARAKRLAEVKRICEDALAYLRDPAPYPPSSIDPSLRSDAFLEEFDDQDVAGFFAAPRHRLYLIDEPEQRLHPALQRRAARWLRSAMGQWGSQCIMATHSIAFIDLPGAHAYELARERTRSTIHPLDPTHLTPYTELARAIGFDRGELLPRWRAFLLADPNTAALLDEFYPDRLERAWIKLIPIDPDTARSSLAEIQILWQLTTAPLILLSVSPSPEDITQLRDADAAQRAQASLRSPEFGIVAKALQLAITHEHQIELLTLDQRDVLDLLDPQTIRDATHTGKHPPYPGHQAAREQYNQAAARDPQLTYPSFLNATFGITHDPDMLRAIAKRMKEQPPPPALLDRIWEIEQIALTGETTSPQPS